MICGNEEALDFSQKTSSLQIQSVSLPTVPAAQDYSTPVKQKEFIKNESPTSTTESANDSTGASGVSSIDPNYFQTQAADLLRCALMNPIYLAGQNYSASFLSSSGGMSESCRTMINPEQSMMPSTSLAMAAFQRRKRKYSVTGSSDNEASSSEGPLSPRKTQKMTPGDDKDDSYWERRRKNNLAAKRSRDARRAKEDEIAFRAAVLEQENVKLKAQVNVLKSEMSRLHYVLFAQKQQQ